MDFLSHLARSDYFADMSEASLALLAEICIPKDVAKHQTIFLEGQTGHSVYIVLSGRVQIYKMSPEGREIVIKVLGPGEVFAEVVLFEHDAFPVSAAALTDVELLAISKIQFTCLLENPRFRDDFIAMLMRKQRYLTERILSLSSQNVEARFFRFLEEQFGRKERYNVSISKKDISSAIGANPETLSRLIQRLSRAEKIEWKGRSLVVHADAWRILDEL